MRNKQDEKVKKVNDSNNALQELVNKKNEEKQKQKAEQLRLQNFRKEKIKKKIEQIKEKENKKLNDIKYNLETIEKNDDIKKEHLLEKFNSLKSRSKDAYYRRIKDFIEKRKSKLAILQRNAEKINSVMESKNSHLIENYQTKINKSIEKSRSIDSSKQYLRYLIIVYFQLIVLFIFYFFK